MVNIKLKEKLTKSTKYIYLVGCAIFAFSNFSTCFAEGHLSYIKTMNVDVNDVNGTGRKLDELCRQFGYVRGIQTDDSIDGYEQSAYEYFFSGLNRYRNLSPYHQLTLSQCIEAMYVNKNNPIWHDVIDCELVLLSSHGGLCSWRAEVIVNTLYSHLYEFLRENRIGYESSGDDLKDILGDVE